MEGIVDVQDTTNYWLGHYPIFNNPAVHVALDGITGKITKAWEYVGKRADKVHIVPHGDQTYPCIALCDLICGYIGRTVHRITDSEILNQIKDKTPAYVRSEFIGDDYIEYLRSGYPYKIKIEQHYPHPLFIVHTPKGIDSNTVEAQEFFPLLLRFAERNGGVYLLVMLLHRKFTSEREYV